MNPRPTPAARPLTEGNIDRLQTMLDAVPAPLDPLDVCMLDGYLCGVLLQPQPVPPERWLRFVTDSDGRALPAGFDYKPLHALVRRRHAELAAAIEGRQWFDPWVFELGEPDDADAITPRAAGPAVPVADADLEIDEQDASPASQAVYPWVAGFALAMAHFPALIALNSKALTAPLALLYRHLEADNLEDADELLAEIETLAPPDDMSQAVEELVRATLLLADVARPRPVAAHLRGHAPRATRGAPRPRSSRR
ncbi:MAG: YecA family protein [Burkholderiales bacterium]